MDRSQGCSAFKMGSVYPDRELRPLFSFPFPAAYISLYKSPGTLLDRAFAIMSDPTYTEKDDVEKGTGNGHSFDHEKTELPAYGNYDNENVRRGSVTAYHENFFSAFHPASFKRNKNARMVTEPTDSEGHPLPDQPPAEPALAMKLKGRHLQMIAIGGSIGRIAQSGISQSA